MNSSKNKPFVLFLLTLIFISAFPIISSASPGEPPTLELFVIGGKHEISFCSPDGESLKFTSITFENHIRYMLYRRDFKRAKEIVIHLSANEMELEYTVSAIQSNQKYSIDLLTGEFTEGDPIKKNSSLVFVRIFLTLIIEGLVFYFFGFWQNESYLKFAAINLSTLYMLHLWINGKISFLGQTLASFVFIGIFIFIFEAILYCIFLTEHSYRRRILFSFTANLASFVLGGLILLNIQS